ncbi:unnamed protein product, partial [Allacma fusca]
MSLDMNNTSASTISADDMSSIKLLKLFYIITSVIELLISCVAVVLNFVFTLSGLWAPENINSNVRILYSMGLVGIFQPIVHVAHLMVHVLLPFVWKTSFQYAYPMGLIILDVVHQIGYLVAATHYFALCLGHWFPLTKTGLKKWLNDDRTLILIAFCWLFPFLWVPMCVIVGGFIGGFIEEFYDDPKFINFGMRIAIFGPVVLM